MTSVLYVARGCNQPRATLFNLFAELSVVLNNL